MSFNDKSYQAISNILIAMIFLLSSCAFPFTDNSIHDALNNQNYYLEIKQLLRDGADVNQKDMFGRTPLYMAALQGDVKLCHLLIYNDADLGKGASWKAFSTPIHVAADKGHTEIVKLFIEKGVEPNIKNAAGDTPLHFAARMKHPHTVLELITLGAKPNIKNNLGEIPLNGIGIKGKGYAGSYKKVVEILVNSGSDINNMNSYGMTPLIDACNADTTDVADVVKYLIQKGARINDVTDYGFTALMSASFTGNINVVKILLKHGADKSIKTIDSKTASFYANKNGHKEVYDLLEMKH